MLTIGYARVSTQEQAYLTALDHQVFRLLAAGASKVYADVASRTKDDRYSLLEIMRLVEAGRASASKSRQIQKQARREQTAQCLRCASGCAMPKGFLCAIHPMGLELHQIPCPDWTAR